MAIITFYSKEKKETGQTLSIASIASEMAIEHNYKILLVATGYKDKSLEDCFWVSGKNAFKPELAGKNVGIESGIEGLTKILASNKTSPEIVKNYSRIVLKDRLDVLESPNATEYKDYANIASLYKDVLQVANRYYDLVFVDLSKQMPKEAEDEILKISDIVFVNLTQRLKTFDDFIELREQDNFYKKTNVMLAIGRYDKFSKYNNKNITRYLKEKKPLAVIPYNTLLFEACSEGTIIDFLLKIRNITDEADRNYAFLKEIGEIDKKIIFKLQELQMKI